MLMKRSLTNTETSDKSKKITIKKTIKNPFSCFFQNYTKIQNRHKPILLQDRKDL